ncbi:MAG: lecithin retinol acyltransferase family protein [Myxococcota bacterium]
MSAGFSNAWVTYTRLHRLPIVAAGLACVLLGVFTALEPIWFFGSLRRLLGLQFVALAVLTFGPWMLGRAHQGVRVHGGLPVLTQAVVSATLGAAFLTPEPLSGRVLATLVWTGLVLDGAVQLLLWFRQPKGFSRVGLLASALVTLGVAIWAASAARDAFWEWIGPLVGLKLILFGLALLGMAWAALRLDHPAVYGSAPFRLSGEPKLGEAYAVYIGNAFHLGLYAGQGDVVDYRNDNKVHLCAWDEFLLGRRPVRWEYPDLPAESPERVAAFAREQVDSTHPYDLMTWNCEHFVIWCKSLGRTSRSRFAQMGLAVSLFGKYPVLGSVVEVHTRFLGWIAYLLGGRAGRRLSLFFRALGALLAMWLVSARRKIDRTA